MVQQNGQSGTTGPRICDVLKATREKAGQDLQAVAQMLRIRYVYLHAIEEGRYDDLPGKTYVVGFVRAYADYLGLDVEQVVSRFKVEYDTVEGKADLVFPSPVTEQSVPTGAVILIGLIALAGAYGGWYFLSSQDRTIAELVPDLSARFEEILETAPADEPDKGLSAEMTGPVTQAAPAAEKTADAAVSEENTETVATEGDAEETQATPEQAPVAVESETTEVSEAVEVVAEAAEEVENTVTEVAETVIAASAENQTAAVEEVTEVVEAIEEAVVEEVSETATPPAAPQATEVAQAEEQVDVNTTEAANVAEAAVEENAEAEAVETADAGAPEVAEPAAPSRDVVIEAVDFAWVQVTDVDGNVLFTQVLNEGDTYTVPRQDNLFLRTGNAGGLRVKVDGEEVPQIGQVGEVRRRVILNADRLIAGDAVEE